MDDRSEAYRALFTRSTIRESLKTFEHEVDRSEFVYDCIKLALETKDKQSIYYGRVMTVNNIIQEVLKT
tara:strand:+ start:624 stop:830 length:207 start_codon:yes stop_codon:yes gene_type:complete